MFAFKLHWFNLCTVTSWDNPNHMAKFEGVKLDVSPEEYTVASLQKACVRGSIAQFAVLEKKGDTYGIKYYFDAAGNKLVKPLLDTTEKKKVRIHCNNSNLWFETNTLPYSSFISQKSLFLFALLLPIALHVKQDFKVSVTGEWTGYLAWSGEVMGPGKNSGSARVKLTDEYRVLDVATLEEA